MLAQYYTSRNSDQTGPFTIHSLQYMVERGQLVASDLVWTEGWSEWCEAGRMPELFAQPEVPTELDYMAAAAENHAAHPPEKPESPNNVLWFGDRNPAMICPHCQRRGRVRTKQVSRKRGISGAKATAAILTGFTSLVVTGLSRKDVVTQCHCGYCDSLWTFG